MKYIILTYNDAVAKQADFLQWLITNSHVPENTDKYCEVVKHVNQDLGAIPVLDAYVEKIAECGVFSQQELANASELMQDWFWHHTDRHIRLKLPTAKLVEQPYDGLFAYLRSAWQALGVTPYPVVTTEAETLVYLEELTDITVDNQTITAAEIEAMEWITVEIFNT